VQMIPFGRMTVVSLPDDAIVDPMSILPMIMRTLDSRAMMMDGPRGSRPTHPKVVDSLPHVVVQSEADALTQCTCSICQDNFQPRTCVVKLPCAHSFCADCVYPWLRTHSTCPCCRAELQTVDEEDGKLHMEPCGHKFMLSEWRDLSALDKSEGVTCPCCNQPAVMVLDED
jgi:hypothetical protein